MVFMTDLITPSPVLVRDPCAIGLAREGIRALPSSIVCMSLDGYRGTRDAREAALSTVVHILEELFGLASRTSVRLKRSSRSPPPTRPSGVKTPAHFRSSMRTFRRGLEETPRVTDGHFAIELLQWIVSGRARKQRVTTTTAGGVPVRFHRPCIDAELSPHVSTAGPSTTDWQGT